HLIVERSIRKETEKKINSITAKINEAFDEKTLLTLVNKIWEEQKSVIESFLNEASQLKRLDALVKYVEEKFKEFDNGVPFEIKQMDPWDLTITIIDISKGTLIYHPNSEQVNKSKSQKQPYQRILKERTGSFVWFNNFMSEQFLAREFKTHKLNSDGRITKIFFEEVRKLGVIVVFESHINLLGSFRRIS
ncbi:MAG: hypothetical protein KDD15_24960, partial [Lewinella sp.]|nr:hypothetical protein [Lewinella sp.]